MKWIFPNGGLRSLLKHVLVLSRRELLDRARTPTNQATSCQEEKSIGVLALSNNFWTARASKCNLDTKLTVSLSSSKKRGKESLFLFDRNRWWSGGICVAHLLMKSLALMGWKDRNAKEWTHALYRWRH